MNFFTMCVLAAGIGMALGTVGTGIGQGLCRSSARNIDNRDVCTVRRHAMTQRFELCAIGDTGTHRLEHHVRIERRRDEHDARAAVLLAERCQAWRQLALAADIDHERSRRRSRATRIQQNVEADASRLQSGGPKGLFEVQVVAEDCHLNHGGHLY